MQYGMRGFLAFDKLIELKAHAAERSSGLGPIEVKLEATE